MKGNTSFHLILYIYSPLEQLFPRILMVTMTTFSGSSLVIKKINWVVETRKVFFSDMPSPNIPGLAIVPPLSSAIIYAVSLHQHAIKII